VLMGILVVLFPLQRATATSNAQRLSTATNPKSVVRLGDDSVWVPPT
jgi:hypothetical protein